MKKFLVCLLLFCSSTLTGATESELHIGKFSSGDLTGWKEQTLGLMKPKTLYSLSKDDEHRQVMVAHSTKSASGQIYKMDLDPKEYSTIKWVWKINHTIKKGDERLKEGDDYAARVYVVFPRGFFSKTRAICYVWANKLPKGGHMVSPYSKNIITVAEDSGDELAGRWTSHQRNILEDYRTFFGEEPPRMGAVAIMTDTDNTGESAVGYYGDISLVRSAKVDESRIKEKKNREINHKESKQKEQLLKEQSKDTGASLPLPINSLPASKVDESLQKEQHNKQPLNDISKPAVPNK